MENKNKLIYTFTSPIYAKNTSATKSALLKNKTLIPYTEGIKNTITPLLDGETHGFTKTISANRNLANKIASCVPSVAVTSSSVDLTFEIAVNDFLSHSDVDDLTAAIANEFLAIAPEDGRYAMTTQAGDSLLIVTEPYRKKQINVSISEEQQTDYEYAITTPLYGTFYPDQTMHEYASDEGVHMESDELIDKGWKRKIETLVAEREGAMENLFGLAPYFDFEGAEKLISVKPQIKVVSPNGWDELVIVTTVKTNEPLSASDMKQLKEQFLGQLSDGWGESLEQQEIKTSDGDLYIHPWNANRLFFYMQDDCIKEPTEEELHYDLEFGQ